MAWNGYSESGQGSSERGPGTYALDVPGMPRAASANASAAPVRAGAEAGRNTANFNINNGGVAQLGNIASQQSLPGVQVAPDPTSELMYRLGGERAASFIKEREQEEFIKGAAQAASGKAMVEIANNKPWYSNVFGDTALIEGARAYSVKAGVAKWSGDQLAGMDELAKRSPNEVPAYLNESIKPFMTGDTATDQQLTQELLGQMPVIVKEHTKRHYMHLQETAKVARGAAMDNVFGNIGAWASDSIDLDKDGYTALEAQLSSVMMPAPGVNEQAHWKQVEAHVDSAVRGGNIHLYRMLGEQGYLKRMPAEQQLSLMTAFKAAVPDAFERSLSDPAIFDRFVAVGSGLMSGDELDAEMKSLNALMAGISGAPEELAQLFPNSMRAKILQQDMTTQQRVASRANEAMQKEITKSADKVAVLTALQRGDPVMLDDVARVRGISKQDIKDIYGDHISKVAQDQVLPSIIQAARMGSSPEVSKALLNKQVGTMFNGEQFDVNGAAGFMKQWSAATDDDRALLAAEMGNPQRAEMVEDVRRAMAAGSTIEGAVASAKVQSRLPKEFKTPDKGSVGAAAQKLIKEKYGQSLWGNLMNAAGSPEASDHDISMLSALSVWASGGASAVPGNAEAVASAGMRVAESRGLYTFIGSRPVLSADPENSLKWTLGQAASEGGRGNSAEMAMQLDALLNEKAGALGIDNATRTVFRLPGKPHAPIQYQIVGIDDQGREVNAIVTSDEALSALRAKDVVLGRLKAISQVHGRRVDEAQARELESQQPSVFQRN